MYQGGDLVQVTAGRWAGCIGSFVKMSKDYPLTCFVTVHRLGTVAAQVDSVLPITMEDAEEGRLPAEFRDGQVALVDAMLADKRAAFERLAAQIVELEGIRDECEAGGEFAEQDRLRLGASPYRAPVGA